MLNIENITYAYGKRPPVIEGMSLTIPSGTICGLLGPNGAGKSTLLSLVTGLLRTEQGSIDYNGFKPEERRVDFLHDVFFVPEEFSLPKMKLRDYIKALTPFYPKFSMSDLERHLAIFEMDSDVHLGRLSMGQKKRVFISFALACNTSLLILDEPTNGLDIHAKRLFRKAVISGMTDEKTIIISTHQVHDVEKVLDSVVIVDKGRVLLDASMADIAGRLAFRFSGDPERIAKALISLDAPGGANIVEPLESELDETEVNLESLFELATTHTEILSEIFSNDKNLK